MSEDSESDWLYENSIMTEYELLCFPTYRWEIPCCLHDFKIRGF